MKLYGHPLSTCTRVVLITLGEKGADAEFSLVDLMQGAQKGAEHLARHPFGVVPVLEHDGFSIYESRAIARYLDRALSGPSLTPSDALAFGRMEQWIGVEQSYFSPNVGALLYQLVLGPMRGQATDAAAVEKAAAGAGKALDVIDAALAGQAFLAGDSLSLADVCWAPSIEALSMAQHGHLVTSRANVAAWWGRLTSRASFTKAFGR